MPHIKIFLPNHEVLNGDWGKGCEFGSLKDFLLFGSDLFLFIVGLSIDQILMDPISSLFYNVEDHWLLATVVDDLIDLPDDEVGVVTGDACDGLYFVFDGGVGVLLGEFEHEVDLVFELIALVGLAHNVELVGRSFLDHVELIQINVIQGHKLVLLVPQVLNLSHPIQIL